MLKKMSGLHHLKNKNISPTAVFYPCSGYSVMQFLISLEGGIYWPEEKVFEVLLVTAGGILPAVTNASLSLSRLCFP